MVIIDEINGEIARLEAQTQTYQTIDKLAALYIVRDHNTIPTDCAKSAQSIAAPVEPVDTHIQYTSDTEFSRAINGRQPGDIWPIMDELMSTIEALVPRLYNGVMRRLQE